MTMSRRYMGAIKSGKAHALRLSLALSSHARPLGRMRRIQCRATNPTALALAPTQMPYKCNHPPRYTCLLLTLQVLLYPDAHGPPARGPCGAFDSAVHAITQTPHWLSLAFS